MISTKTLPIPPLSTCVMIESYDELKPYFLQISEAWLHLENLHIRELIGERLCDMFEDRFFKVVSNSHFNLTHSK